MKYVQIALLLFCIQVGFALVNATGIYREHINPQTEWFSQVDDSELANANYVQGEVSGSNTFGFGDFIKGLFYFVKAFGAGIFAVPYLLGEFGVLFPFTYIISLPIYMLYFVAIAEFIRGMKT